jgi:hypothetical protein
MDYWCGAKAGGLSLRSERNAARYVLPPTPGGGLAAMLDMFTTSESRVNPLRLEVSVSWRAVGMA